MCLASTWSRCKVLLHVCAWLQHEVDVKCLYFNDNTTKILELSVCCSTMTTLQKSLNCRCVALQWQHYNKPWTVDTNVNLWLISFYKSLHALIPSINVKDYVKTVFDTSDVRRLIIQQYMCFYQKRKIILIIMFFTTNNSSGPGLINMKATMECSILDCSNHSVIDAYILKSTMKPALWTNFCVRYRQVFGLCRLN
jgi:hypothetical protein